MTLAGFVVSDAHWEIVKQGLPEQVRVGWVVSTAEAAAEYLATPGTELVIVEAVPEILTSDLVQRIDSEGIPLAALMTSRESDACAEDRGVGHRIRQPDDLRRLLGVAPTERSVEGQVWCVWGPHGSPGRTTIALGLAGQLAYMGTRVLVIDADSQGGTVAPALGLIDKTPGFLASMRRFRRGELRRDSLLDLVVTYRGGAVQFGVLSGVARKYSSAEAPTEGIHALLTLCREMFDFTLVDVGSEFLGDSEEREDSGGARALSDVMDCADQIVALCRADPAGVSRFARAYPVLAARVGLVPHVWLNGVDFSRRAVGEDATIREVLWRFAGVDKATALPWDPGTCRKAAMNAVTVRDMSSASPLVTALAREIGTLLPARTPAPEPAPVSTRRTAAAQAWRVSWRGLRQKWLRVTALR